VNSFETLHNDLRHSIPPRTSHKMDFLERMGEQAGERYLMGKAKAAPQQLETLAKKQFGGGAAKPEKATGAAALGGATTTGEGGHAGAIGSLEKDEEIAALRKQLAATKLQKGAATAAAKYGAAGGAGAKVGKGRKAQEILGVGKGSGKELKEKKGLEALGAGTGIKTGAHGKKQFEAIGRRKSHSKAVREGLPALSGASKSKGAKEDTTLMALLGADAGGHGGHSKAEKSERRYGSEASHSKAGKSEKGHGSEEGHSKAAKSKKAHGSEAGSSIGRRHSVSSHHTHAEKASKKPHGSEKPKRSKSVKAPSGHESDGSSTVMSLSGQEEYIRKHHYEPSEYGHEKHSSVKSIASYAKHPKAPSHHGSEHGGVDPSMALIPAYGEGRRGVNGYREPSVYSYSGESGEMYVVQVEEELSRPKRRKNTIERGGGAVEVSHTKARTLYVVRD